MGAEASRDPKIRSLFEGAVRPAAAVLSAVEPASAAIDDAAADADVDDGSRRYSYRGELLTTERHLVTRFLDDFRAAESAGATVLSGWAAVARDPSVRGGLRVLCARETRHGELLAQRLHELGAACHATLGPDLTDAAGTRLGSPRISDLEKLQELLVRHADVDMMLHPIRDVIVQIDEDQETRALLSAILEEEIVTLRWISATSRRLEASR